MPSALIAVLSSTTAFPPLVGGIKSGLPTLVARPRSAFS